MKIVGLLGGVASGKTTVAQMFQRLGAGVLDADQAGHDVLRLPHVRAAIGGRWGPEVIGADGQVDRLALGRIVFAPPPAGPRELAHLESLTHGEIRKLLLAQIQSLADSGVQVAILDAPVLLKAGWDAMCDRLVFVESPDELRLARAERRGWTAEEFRRREASQESVDAKRQVADFVLDNSKGLGYTQAQVERCMQSLLGPQG